MNIVIFFKDGSKNVFVNCKELNETDDCITFKERTPSDEFGNYFDWNYYTFYKNNIAGYKYWQY